MTRATLAHTLVVARNHPDIYRVANWPDILSISENTTGAFYCNLAFTLPQLDLTSEDTVAP
jgi:hypothetical protein